MLFGLARLGSSDPTPTGIVPLGLHLEYTSVLNLVALLVFGYLFWLYGKRDRLRGGAGYAKNVVCGTHKVQKSIAPATAGHASDTGRNYHFCSTGCRDRFTDGPEDFLDQDSAPPGGHQRRRTSRHSP